MHQLRSFEDNLFPYSRLRAKVMPERNNMPNVVHKVKTAVRYLKKKKKTNKQTNKSSQIIRIVEGVG